MITSVISPFNDSQARRVKCSIGEHHLLPCFHLCKQKYDHIIQLIFQASSFAMKAIEQHISKTQTKSPQQQIKKNQKNQQNIYSFYSHYTAVGNDLQTVQLTEHPVTGFMFSHILFNVML